MTKIAEIDLREDDVSMSGCWQARPRCCRVQSGERKKDASTGRGAAGRSKVVENAASGVLVEPGGIEPPTS